MDTLLRRRALTRGRRLPWGRGRRRGDASRESRAVQDYLAPFDLRATARRTRRHCAWRVLLALWTKSWTREVLHATPWPLDGMLAGICKCLRCTLAKREKMRIQRRTQGQVFASVSEGQPVNKNDNEPVMRICAFCGSPRPEELLPQCAHGLVAIVRGKERQAFARLHVAFQAMPSTRATRRSTTLGQT